MKKNLKEEGSQDGISPGQQSTGVSAMSHRGHGSFSKVKTNRYFKEVKAAEEKKLQKEERERQAVVDEGERKKKVSSRRRLSRKLNQRTKKGQIVMKHEISRLLSKIENG